MTHLPNPVVEAAGVAAKPIAHRLSRGRPLLVLSGIIVGAGSGWIAGTPLWPFTTAVAIACGLLGGFLAAVLFPAPEPIQDEIPKERGEIIVTQNLQPESSVFRYCIVLMENCLYIGAGEDLIPDEIVDSLSNGVVPRPEFWGICELRSILRIEFRENETGDFVLLTVKYTQRHRDRTIEIPCSSPESRMLLIDRIEEQIGKPFVRSEEPIGLLLATFVPSCAAIVTFLATWAISRNYSWGMFAACLPMSAVIWRAWNRPMKLVLQQGTVF